MLCLVGGPSANTLPLTPFERGFAVSVALTFICLLRHVCLVALRAVTSPSVIDLVLISFASALLSSAWMFACLLNYLPVSLTILLLMVVKSLKSYLYYIS